MGFDKASSVGRLIWRPTLWWIPGFNGQNIPGDPSSLSLMIVSTDERVSINGCVNDTKQNLSNTYPFKTSGSQRTDASGLHRRQYGLSHRSGFQKGSGKCAYESDQQAGAGDSKCDCVLQCVRL